MNKLILLLITALSGCMSFEGPTDKLDINKRLVFVYIYDSYEELSLHPKAPKVDGILKGFSVYNNIMCEVHYVHNDYETFIHEMKHCYYGDWHP